MDAAVVRRLDIMLHVADVKRLILLKVVFLDDIVDFLPLVPDAEVKFFKAPVHSGVGRLHGEIVGVDRAENEAADFPGLAKVQKVVRMRQRGDVAAHFTETAVEPALECL